MDSRLALASLPTGQAAGMTKKFFMKIVLKHILVSVGLMALLALPFLASAANLPSDNLKTVGEKGNAPYRPIAQGTNDLASIIGTVIQVFLGLLGVLFLVYMLYAGYNWMIAQGDEEKVTKAKETIQRAIIGLIIIIAAYAISYWVFGSLVTGTGIISN
jgi:hypothetical protein